jgi:curli biogenesis system outer membrane secretion channel CsgG
MSKVLIIAITLMLFGIISGCATITADRPYYSSTDNIIKLKSKLSEPGTKVKLGTFTESDSIGGISCRGDGSINVSPGKTQAKYIEDALKTELYNAGLYAVDADTELVGELVSLKASSVSQAYWEIELFISSNKSAGYSVKTRFEFETSWMAGIACKNLVDAYGPAVQRLISEIVDHPDFIVLIGQ